MTRSTDLTKFALTGVAASLFLSACGGAAIQAAGSGKTTNIMRGTLLATVSATGNVQPNDEVKLSFAASGQVASVNVKVGQSVKKGDVIATLDIGEYEIALSKARVAVRSAENALIIAQTGLSRTIDGPRPADLAAANASLGAAQANYDKLAAGPRPGDFAAADARLRNAEAALKRAQAAYDQAYAYDPASITASPAALQLEQATNDYNAAKAERERAAEPADPADKRAAQQRIAEARANIDKLRQPARPHDIERAKAEIKQAELQVEQAILDVQQNERRIAQSKLIAPMDGMISAVDIKAGEAVGQNSTVTMIDLSQLITDINVDEIDIAKVREGQDVSVRLDSLPGVNLAGKIVRISPTSKLVNGVVSYAVRVSIPAGEAALRPGMTANTRIVLERHENVLLVPNWALRRDKATGKTFVTLPPQGEGAQPSEIEVKLGLKDEENAEVVDGLKEGQAVQEPAIR
jgi:HlyD family secretion protein